MARILVALFFSLVCGSAAQAQSTFFGPAEKLIYVGTSEFPGSTEKQALCVQVTDFHLFYLPIGRTAVGYAFAESSCQADTFEPIPASSVEMLRSAGVISTDVPDIPELSYGWAWQTMATFLIGILAIIGFPLLLRRRMREASLRTVGASQDPLFYDILLTVMYHVAHIDGVIERSEVQAVARTFKMLTGAKVTPEMAAEKFTQTLRDNAVLGLIKQCDDEQGKVLIDAAISVATFAGVLPREKRVFIESMNATLGRDPDVLQAKLDAELKTPTIALESECHRTVNVA